MFYHHPQNQERALNLSILIVSGPGEFPRVESNQAAGSTPGGALPSMSLSFSLATIFPPEPKHFDFSEGRMGREYNTVRSLVGIVYG